MIFQKRTYPELAYFVPKGVVFLGFIATFAVSLRFLLSLDSQHQDKWKNLTWQNPEQQKVARELVKLMNQLSCGMREINMKNLIFVLLALSSLIMVSCANADSLVGSTTLFDYNRSNHQVVDSSFLSGLSVVELEQTPTGPVVEIDRMIEIDGNLCVFFQSQGKVAMFDGKGKFLREICRRGKGHGEYTQLVDVAYDKYNDEFLFLVAPSSIMRYSKTGIFKDKKELDKLYSEIAVDSSFIYLYNPTYTKDAKMDYTIECINKKNGERKQLLEMNEDYSPYSSVGFRMFATKQGVSFVRKFDNCIYDIKNGELKHLSHIDLKGCAYNNKSGDDLSTVELTNECWREKKIYSFANVARSNDYLIFSSNLWDVNICDLKKKSMFKFF